DENVAAPPPAQERFQGGRGALCRFREAPLPTGGLDPSQIFEAGLGDGQPTQANQLGGPAPYRTVATAACQELAVGTHGQAVDVAVMPCQDLYTLPAAEVPEPNAMV